MNFLFAGMPGRVLVPPEPSPEDPTTEHTIESEGSRSTQICQQVLDLMKPSKQNNRQTPEHITNEVESKG